MIPSVSLAVQIKPTCHYFVFIRNKSTGKMSHVKLACHSWKCETCAEKKLKPFWKSHLAAMIAEHGGPIYQTWCSEAEHLKVYMRHYRSKGKWCCVKAGCGNYAFFSTKRTLDSHEMEMNDAIQMLHEIITNARIGHKIISTSRSWKNRKAKEDKFEKVSGPTSATVTAAAIELANEKGIRVKSWTPEPGSAVEAGLELDTKGYTIEGLMKLIGDIRLRSLENEKRKVIHDLRRGIDHGRTYWMSLNEDERWEYLERYRKIDWDNAIRCVIVPA